MQRRTVVALGLALASVGCTAADLVVPEAASGAAGGKSDEVTKVGVDAVEHTDLHIDLATLHGEATVTFVPSDAPFRSLRVPGLIVHDVHDGERALPFTVEAGNLLVDTTSAEDPDEVTIEYAFSVHADSDGLLAGGSTVIWPYHCGNVFPCNPEPADGMTFSLDLEGVADTDSALYPEELPADAPPYTMAWAVGEYTCQALGETTAGTRVKVCWLPRGKTKALDGTKRLVKVMDWLETNIGPYTFGEEVASIAAQWGESAAGGMEHHPYWHVAVEDMGTALTHAHEAVHGWYGTGIRIRCWEDFVLSEGTTTYLAARALGAVAGPEVEAQVWEEYADDLLATLEDEDIIVWPETCGAVDVLKDGLFSNLVYYKGAFFFRDIADQIGAEALDRILADFYAENVGQAVGMADLVDFIGARTELPMDEFVDFWLRSLGSPFE